MTRDELLGSLRLIELRLSTSEVNSFFRNLPDNETNTKIKQAFVDLSLKISSDVSILTTAGIEDIADELEKNEAELKAGINSLQHSIIQLNDAIAIVGTLSTVLGLVARVLAF